MFRKLTFAAVTGLGLLAAAPAAEARPYHGRSYHHHHRVVRYHHGPYRVWYRPVGGGWACYGSYPSYPAARGVLIGLRAHGCPVYIR
jgi:hypothetical protein